MSKEPFISAESIQNLGPDSEEFYRFRVRSRKDGEWITLADSKDYDYVCRMYDILYDNYLLPEEELQILTTYRLIDRK